MATFGDNFISNYFTVTAVEKVGTNDKTNKAKGNAPKQVQNRRENIGSCHLETVGKSMVFKRMYKSGKECFYRGLTKTIRKRLIPEGYSISSSRNYNNTSSVGNGTLIHRHVHHQVSCLDKNGGICDCGIKTPNKRVNKMARIMLDYMQKHSLTPTESEFTVFNDDVKVATNIDIVCKRLESGGRDGGVCIISIKTGYETKRMKVPKMLGRFDKLDATHENVHSAQACFEFGAYQDVVGVAPDDYIIVYLSKNTPGGVIAKKLDGVWKTREMYKKLIESFRVSKG